jgi:hypothetical protein
MPIAHGTKNYDSKTHEMSDLNGWCCSTLEKGRGADVMAKLLNKISMQLQNYCTTIDCPRTNL